jgi:hypothetical protein
VGVVTEYVFNLVAKQVNDRGLVVWYDPERAYVSAVELLSFPNTIVVRYQGSFFQLRHEIDHLLNGQQAPRLIVYVPEDQGQTNHALVELEAAGVIMQPGQQPPQRNTRIAVVARNALRPILGDETAAEVEKQVESGKLSLTDLDNLASKGKEISTGVLSLIFASANPQDVALAFLSTDKFDAEVEKKSARKELFGLLRNAYDIEFSASVALAEARDGLARHVLLTDLVEGLGDSLPPALVSAKVALSPSGSDLSVSLARNWRLRRDVRDSYVVAANKVEQEFSLATLKFDPDKLCDLETFLACERGLLRHVEQQLFIAPGEELRKLAEFRLAKFWADVLPTIQARWALVASAAEVLVEAERVSKALKKSPAFFSSLIEAYAEGETPWCLLDTHHRHMESRWYNFEPVSGEDHNSLEQLIVKAEQRYAEVGSQLAQYFIEQFSKTKHPISGLLRQRDIFETQVKPKLTEGKVAYVWVDALRFEMARELCRLLKDDFALSIQPALGTIPTITRSAWRHCCQKRISRPRSFPWEAGNSGWKLTEQCSRIAKIESPF